MPGMHKEVNAQRHHHHHDQHQEDGPEGPGPLFILERAKERNLSPLIHLESLHGAWFPNRLPSYVLIMPGENPMPPAPTPRLSALPDPLTATEPP